MQLPGLGEQRKLGRAWLALVDALSDAQATELEGFFQMLVYTSTLTEGKVPIPSSVAKLAEPLLLKTGRLRLFL